MRVCKYLSFQSSARRPQAGDRIWCKPAKQSLQTPLQTGVFARRIDVGRCETCGGFGFPVVKIGHFPRLVRDLGNGEFRKDGSFAPMGRAFFRLVYPRLASWAGFFRRFAAGGREGLLQQAEERVRSGAQRNLCRASLGGQPGAAVPT